MEPAVKFPRRDEESINKSLLTGLDFPRIFMEEATRFIPRVKPNEYCMVAIDILHFRLLNKFHGRTSGDKLLRKVADYLEENELLPARQQPASELWDIRAFVLRNRIEKSGLAQPSEGKTP